MMEWKKIMAFFGIFFLIISLYYTTIYVRFKFTEKNNVVSTERITDFQQVSQDKLTAVQTSVSFFELDQNGNFNPQKELTRIDGIITIDKLAKNILKTYSTTKPSVVPYFEDFKSSDANSDAILRVVNLIDNKEGYYKHYNILTYKLERQKSLSHREFLTLLASLIPVNKDLGDDYIIKNLNNYGIDYTGDLNRTLLREDAAVYVNTLMQNIKN